MADVALAGGLGTRGFRGGFRYEVVKEAGNEAKMTKINLEYDN